MSGKIFEAIGVIICIGAIVGSIIGLMIPDDLYLKPAIVGGASALIITLWNVWGVTSNQKGGES